MLSAYSCLFFSCLFMYLNLYSCPRCILFSQYSRFPCIPSISHITCFVSHVICLCLFSLQWLEFYFFFFIFLLFSSSSSLFNPRPASFHSVLPSPLLASILLSLLSSTLHYFSASSLIFHHFFISRSPWLHIFSLSSLILPHYILFHASLLLIFLAFFFTTFIFTVICCFMSSSVLRFPLLLWHHPRFSYLYLPYLNYTLSS